jgi:hypothetical protein
MIGRSVLLLILIASLAGCASSHGLSRQPLEAALLEKESRFAGEPLSAGHPIRPRAPVLGLYLNPTGFLNREFEWTGRDRDLLLTGSHRLFRESAGRSAGFVTMSSLKGESLKELRASAARYGVDWLLVVDGAAAVDRYNNYKAPLLYWTIVGAYMADGTHSDALCLLKATVWDVATGARLFEEQAEAMTKAVGPAALIDDTREIERAKTQAMETLLQGLTDRFAHFLGKPR